MPPRRPDPPFVRCVRCVACGFSLHAPPQHNTLAQDGLGRTPVVSVLHLVGIAHLVERAVGELFGCPGDNLLGVGVGVGGVAVVALATIYFQMGKQIAYQSFSPIP